MKTKWMHGVGLTVVLMAYSAGAGRPEGLDSPNPVERRNALIEVSRRGEEAIPFLARALDDEQVLVRRTALRALLDIGPPARAAVQAATRSSDANLRHTALLGLDAIGAVTVDDLRRALRDEEQVVRREAVRILSAIRPRTERIDDLLREAGSDPSHVVRSEVLQGILGQPEGGSVRDEEMDRAISVIRTLRLPAAGWTLKFDPEGTGQGHLLGWYRESFDDSEWEDAQIETAWEPGYIGVGWYRTEFELPEKFDTDGVELHFAGVDESCWVWINGRYAGARDIGPVGWDIPYILGVSDLVRWGEKNQITVRVMNTRGAGGIWKPVTLRFLRVR